MATSQLKKIPVSYENGFTIQNSINNVPANVETPLVSYTVPIGKKITCVGGVVSGMTDATFKYYVDNAIKEILRINWTERNASFSTIEKMEAGKIVKITVQHHAINTHDFDGSIFAFLL